MTKEERNKMTEQVQEVIDEVVDKPSSAKMKSALIDSFNTMGPYFGYRYSNSPKVSVCPKSDRGQGHPVPPKNPKNMTRKERKKYYGK